MKAKPILLFGVMMSLLFVLAGCSSDTQNNPTDSAVATTSEERQSIMTESQASSEFELTISVNGTALSVVWEDNESVNELARLLENGSITVQSENYGGFEQVWKLPQRITQNDVQTTTEPGDIVLYSGNSIVLFYGSNSWAYTKLGHIDGLSTQEIENLLNVSAATITISYDKSLNE